jgi:enoyl-CoA hydratase
MIAGPAAGRTLSAMSPRLIDLDSLRDLARPGAVEVPGGSGTPESPLLLVDLDPSAVRADQADAPDAPGVPDSGFPFVVVGLTGCDDPETHPARGACDVVLARDTPAVDAVVATVEAQPLAATALAQVLRHSPARSVDDGLLVESAVYSTLQGGPEFARWRASRPVRERAVEGAAVAVALARHGDRLDVTLTRPQVRNALDTAMRDQLVDAFRLVALDASIREVHLRGAGPSFSAGGDLDEFGSFPDPATAHAVRLVQSVGRLVAAVADRVTAHLHGACFGSGIEVPAFAGTVVAAPDTTIALPEVALGLIPGAGGTVSVPRRIGRHRTARLALTGERIDATTALAWGLVDALDDLDAT